MTPVRTENGIEIQVEQLKKPLELQTAKTIKKGNRTGELSGEFKSTL
jgi:hypothetical protein